MEERDMDVKINYISSTDKFDFYTVNFLNFCTGTMQLEKAKKLKAYLELRIPIVQQNSIDEFAADLGGWIKDEDTLEFITELRNDILKSLVYQ
jgi:hypothetical protein